ncbi:MAG: hypothetical protein U0Q18_37660 [Bryobacteraceae bacterium]
MWAGTAHVQLPSGRGFVLSTTYIPIDCFRQGAIHNVKAFVESIRAGKPINNAVQSVDSNLNAILGRTAAYRQQMVTWDELMASEEKYEVELKLQW